MLLVNNGLTTANLNGFFFSEWIFFAVSGERTASCMQFMDGSSGQFVNGFCLYVCFHRYRYSLLYRDLLNTRTLTIYISILERNERNEPSISTSTATESWKCSYLKLIDDALRYIRCAVKFKLPPLKVWFLSLSYWSCADCVPKGGVIMLEG